MPVRLEAQGLLDLQKGITFLSREIKVRKRR